MERAHVIAAILAALLLVLPVVSETYHEEASLDTAGPVPAFSAAPGGRANGTDDNGTDENETFVNDTDDGGSQYAPDPPTNLRWMLKESLEIHWDQPADYDVDGVLYYHILWGVSPDNLTYFDVMDGDATFYPDYYAVYWIFVLDEPSTFYYSVVAVNGWGESPPSEVLEVELEVDLSAINRMHVHAPYELRAEAGDDSVILSWKSGYSGVDESVIGFQVYREGAGHSGSTPIAELPQDVWTYEDTNVIPGNQYSYRVTCFSSLDESQYSERVTVVIPRTTSRPFDLHTAGGDDYIDVYWNAPRDDGGHPITSYRLYRSTHEDDYILLQEIVLEPGQNPPGALHYRDKDVKEGKRYTYTVTAVNAAGESEDSQSFTGTTKENVADDGRWLCFTLIVIIGIFIVLILNFFISRKREERALARGIEYTETRRPEERGPSVQLQRRGYQPEDLRRR